MLSFYLAMSLKKLKQTLIRNSRWQMFFKTGVLKNFAIFPEGTFVGDLLACNFIKKKLQHRCFPLSIAKCLLFYRTPLAIAFVLWDLGFNSFMLFGCLLHQLTGFYKIETLASAYFWPIFQFYPPWKYQKLIRFLVFIRSIK